MVAMLDVCVYSLAVNSRECETRFVLLFDFFVVFFSVLDCLASLYHTKSFSWTKPPRWPSG